MSRIHLALHGNDNSFICKSNPNFCRDQRPARMESSTKNEHESEQQMLHSCPDNEKNSDNHDAIEEKLPNNQSNGRSCVIYT